MFDRPLRTNYLKFDRSLHTNCFTLSSNFDLDLELWPRPLGLTFDPKGQTVQAGERKWRNGQTNKCYQTYNLPCFVVDKHYGITPDSLKFKKLNWFNKKWILKYFGAFWNSQIASQVKRLSYVKPRESGKAILARSSFSEYIRTTTNRAKVCGFTWLPWFYLIRRLYLTLTLGISECPKVFQNPFFIKSI